MGSVGHEGRPWHDTRGWLASPREGEVAPSASGNEIAEECEAFLSGSFADLQGSRHQPVEAWAWVNRVAHAEPEELRVLASRPAMWRGGALRKGGFRTRRWRRAVSDMASDLLSIAEGKPRMIKRLQGRALVPLELELAARGKRYPVTPELLVAKARGALYRGKARSSPEVLAGPGGYFERASAYPWASPGWKRARNVVLATLAVVVVGGLVVFGATKGVVPPASSSVYRYYLSRLDSLDNRSLQNPDAFTWITGGKEAPGWEAGRDLPTFLLPWQAQGPGSYMGWLFAGAPGPVLKGAAAERAAAGVPAGASVDAVANTVRFSRPTVSFKVAALPGHRLRVAGLSSPTVIVPYGAVVRMDLVVEDTTSAHGLAVVHAGASRSWMPMASTETAFSGAALWFLGDETLNGAHEGVVTFRAAKPGTYQYLDPVPGEAKAGMAGTFVVSKP